MADGSWASLPAPPASRWVTAKSEARRFRWPSETLAFNTSTASSLPSAASRKEGAGLTAGNLPSALQPVSSAPSKGAAESDASSQLSPSRTESERSWRQFAEVGKGRRQFRHQREHGDQRAGGRELWPQR